MFLYGFMVGGLTVALVWAAVTFDERRKPPRRRW